MSTPVAEPAPSVPSSVAVGEVGLPRLSDGFPAWGQQHTSVTSRVLTRSIYDELQGLRTDNGVTLDDIIRVREPRQPCTQCTTHASPPPPPSVVTPLDGYTRPRWMNQPWVPKLWQTP